MYHLDWFEKEQKRQEEHRLKTEVSLLNQNLQRLLHRVLAKCGKREEYRELERQLIIDFRVVQSSLTELRYVNNMESLDVAVAQGIYIHILLWNTDTELPSEENELDYLMRRLANIDFQHYQRYASGRDIYL